MRRRWQRYKIKPNPDKQPQARAPVDAAAQATPAAATDVAAAQAQPRRRRFNLHGIVLDVLVIACNLFLLGPLARVLRAGGRGFLQSGRAVSGDVSPTVGWLFLLVFVAYTLGAYLKRLPRQARSNTRLTGRPTNASERTRGRRLMQRTASWREPNKLLVVIVCALLLAHFFIFLTLLTSGWQNTELNDWSPLFGSRPGHSAFFEFLVRFVLFIFILPLPTGLTLISLTGGDDSPTDTSPPTWRIHWATELIADLLLYFAIVVITLIMNVLIAPRFVSPASVAGWTPGNVWPSLVPLALAFSIFYLPPRLIYLADDYRRPFAWLTILLALLTLAYRTYFPAETFSW